MLIFNKLSQTTVATWTAETAARRYIITRNPHTGTHTATVVSRNGKGECDDVLRFADTFNAAARACQAYSDRRVRAASEMDAV